MGNPIKLFLRLLNYNYANEYFLDNDWLVKPSGIWEHEVPGRSKEKQKPRRPREEARNEALFTHDWFVKKNTWENDSSTKRHIKLKVQEWQTYCKMDGYVANERQTGEDKYWGTGAGRQTERQRKRQAGRQRDREKGRQTDRESQTDRQRDREKGRQADGETEKKADRQRDREKGRQTERYRKRQAGRQSQTNRDRGRQSRKVAEFSELLRFEFMEAFMNTLL